jgi:hypothetical protein
MTWELIAGGARLCGALALSVALTTAVACSGPTAEHPSPTPTAKTLGAKQPWVDYAKCLRQNGFDEPDPTFDDAGLIHWQKSLDNAPPQVKQACTTYLNKALDPSGGKPVTAQHLAEEQELAQCMRKHGLPDFPDPDPQTGAIRIQKGGDMDPQSPVWQGAIKACKGGGDH